MQPRRIQRYPGPDHPIAVDPAPGRIIVRFGDLSLLERTAHRSYCPYKGEASYYSISTSGNRWRTPYGPTKMPYEAVSGIKDYLAFYPDRVEAIEVVT